MGMAKVWGNDTLWGRLRCGGRGDEPMAVCRVLGLVSPLSDLFQYSSVLGLWQLHLPRQRPKLLNRGKERVKLEAAVRGRAGQPRESRTHSAPSHAPQLPEPAKTTSTSETSRLREVSNEAMKDFFFSWALDHCGTFLAYQSLYRPGV